MKDDEFAIVDGAPERAVLRTGKGKPMKARLLKKWGTNYAGQVLSNVDKSSIPAGVAEFFDDDDPAVNTVVSQASADSLMVVNDEINPAHAKAQAEAQRAEAKASREVGDKAGVAEAVAELEEEQTQERARDADEFAASRRKKGGKSSLSKGQIEKNKAGKGHGRRK